MLIGRTVATRSAAVIGAISRGVAVANAITESGMKSYGDALGQVRIVHHIEDRALAEGMRDDLGAPFLAEEPLEQVGGADRSGMAQGKAQSKRPV